MGVGTARAKLLLFGEHAAVYGHPAVGLSLPWTLQVTRTPGPWEFPGLGPHEAGVRALVSRLEKLAADAGLPAPGPGGLGFESQVPLGAGFGSSGALCAALVNLFWPTLPLADRDRLAWQAEGLFHGTPSGIDTALALREGWWALDPSTRPVTARALPDPNLVLVTGALVRETDTKTLVTALAARRAAGDRLVVENLALLGDLSAEAVRVLTAGKADGLPPLVNRAREGLRALGLETPAMTDLLDAGLRCPGALAGKLSGAGGGGAFFLLFDDRSRAEAAAWGLAKSADHRLWVALPRVI